MAVRTSMNSLVAYEQRLVGQTSASSPWTGQQIQDALDLHRTHFDWVLLGHDPDFRRYYTTAHVGTHRTDQIISLSKFEFASPDFAFWTQVGFFEDNVVLREGREESAAAHAANDNNLFDGTFTFSTVPNVELYIYGDAYNVWQTAADLLLEGIDFGRLPIKSVSRGGVSYSYAIDEKIKLYHQRARGLNRRIKRMYRA